MKLQMAGLVLGIALIGNGCGGDEDKDPAPQTQTETCTAGQLNQSKCQANGLTRCDGAVWQAVIDCAAQAQECWVFTPGVAACVIPEAPQCIQATQIAGGSWDTEEIDAKPDFISRASVAMSGNDVLHVTYDVSNDHDTWTLPSLWYATNATGSWTTAEIVPAGTLSREFPVVAVSPAGKVSVIYNSYVASSDQSELYMVTNDGAGFTAPVNVTNSAAAAEYGAIIGYDAAGTLHIVHQRLLGGSDYRLGYTQVATDGTVTQEDAATDTIEYAAAIADDGTVHVAYMQGDETTYNSVLWYRYRDPVSGAWSTLERVTDPATSSGSPVLAVGCDGTLHMGYTVHGGDYDETLTYLRRTGGEWGTPQALTATVNDRTYFLGMQVNASGTVVLAYAKLDDDSWGDVFVLRGHDGVFDAEVQLTDSRDTEENSPAVALAADGKSVVVYPVNGPDFPASALTVSTWK